MAQMWSVKLHQQWAGKMNASQRQYHHGTGPSALLAGNAPTRYNNSYWIIGELAMPISADLGPVLEDYVAELVESGRYNSKSEVIREGVRLVQEREARFKVLDAAIARGLEDESEGRVRPANAVFEDLAERYRGKAAP
jgi:antitoxin ParD1/3/4